MRDSLRMIAALRSGLFTGLDLLFEILALRHQLGVLARADRRFRRADRLLWVCLRRWWPRWKDALILVQPATVARWQREGFRGWWRHHSRRGPGRPRIDSELQALLRRMCTENLLWGAPRIHGELLKLGITVSERTVSRYLPHRLGAPSQTWRTFLANHLGTFAFGSTVKSLDASSDDVIDTDASPFRSAMSSVDALGTSNRRAPIEPAPTLHSSRSRWQATQAPLNHTTCAGCRSGKDPPHNWAA